MSIEKPMLSDPAPDDLSTLRFPVAVSPKLDGIRAIVRNGVVLTRSLKPVRNAHVQRLFGKYEGFDGELIVGSPTARDVFRVTTSGVMSSDGEPDVKFHIFDHLDDPHIQWEIRMGRTHTAIELDMGEHLHLVDQVKCWSPDEILECERRWVAQGYEGVMIRNPSGHYKHGRATTREGLLLKLKRFHDSEAEVIGYEEKLHNANPTTVNALGHTERSTHQEGLIPMGTLGALTVRDIHTGVTFNVGTGFDDSERDRWWAMGEQMLGRLIKYKSFLIGGYDKPRFPTYIGERSQADL